MSLSSPDGWGLVVATSVGADVSVGVATGITHGAVNYSDFPHSFLMLGQGYIGGAVPVQLRVGTATSQAGVTLFVDASR